MTIFVPLMMFGWLPFTLALFAFMKPRQAAAIALIVGWLFLPNAQYSFPGIPDYSKIPAVCLPIILGTLFFDNRQLSKFHFGKLDIPILVLCICPLSTSLANGLGAYDGISGIIQQFFNWGLPYVIGKMYFSDKEGLREIARWIVIGGLIYIPFCLWEMRMSPNLHYYIYGFRTDSFTTTIRFGGNRPVVFLRHGIALGLWMMSTVYLAFWLWRSRVVQYIHILPMGLVTVSLLVVFLLCRSLNAIVLFSLGVLAYHAIKTWRMKVMVVCLAMLPVVYIVARNNGMITSDSLTEIASDINADRARSLYIRLSNEEQLQNKAWQRPVFGWGGWGRSRVYDENGKDISITDGLWIIIFGSYGLVGLISLGLVLLLPSFVFWRKYRSMDWRQPDLAPMVGFACFLPLYTIDCLMNAMVNPIYTVVASGMLGWLALDTETGLA